MTAEQTEWIQSISGQQVMLSVYRVILSKKSNDVITLKDLKPTLPCTSEQVETCVEHFVHIDVLNEFKSKDSKGRIFSVYR